MRDYGKVHTSFWISDGMRRVSDDARLLALYLLTGQHTNMIGCFRLPDGYVSEDLAWTPERVSKGFDELSSNGFATRDKASKWVLIRNFLSWNSVENPNQGIAALRLFDQVPDKSSIKPELARVLAAAIAHIGSAKLKGSERVLLPFLNQEQEQEQEQDKDILGHGSATPQRVNLQTKLHLKSRKAVFRRNLNWPGRNTRNEPEATARLTRSKPGLPELNQAQQCRSSSMVFVDTLHT